jgi:class 3 adenylate cyclase
MGDDVGGIAVHIAARVMAVAEPGEVLVSSSVLPSWPAPGSSSPTVVREN